jgi:hypothetical protein
VYPVRFYVQPYANWGRWVIDCPRCPNAEDTTPDSTGFLCTECGARADIEWPSGEMVYGIERLLLMRPDRTKQNWYPGETLADLMWENGQHGIFDIPDELEPTLIVDPERIRVDTLPPTFRRELGPIPKRRAI